MEKICLPSQVYERQERMCINTFLKFLLRTFWAGKYTDCAVLRKSVCHELAPCSRAEKEDDAKPLKLQAWVGP